MLLSLPGEYRCSVFAECRHPFGKVTGTDVVPEGREFEPEADRHRLVPGAVSGAFHVGQGQGTEVSDVRRKFACDADEFVVRDDFVDESGEVSVACGQQLTAE